MNHIIVNKYLNEFGFLDSFHGDLGREGEEEEGKEKKEIIII